MANSVQHPAIRHEWNSDEVVINLRSECLMMNPLNKPLFAKGHISLPSKATLTNYGFIGALSAVFLSSQTKMTHDSPACLAAPLITLVAKEAIDLGVKGKKDSPIPVCLYAPEQISISTPHLSVGEIQLVAMPKFGYISCEKITFFKSGEKDPEYFDIIKSWVINKNVVIEYKQIEQAIKV